MIFQSKLLSIQYCYANAPLDEHGNTKDGAHWKNSTIHEPQAFMALALYMKLKV